MEITIVRFGRYHHAVSGKLLIDGQLVCGTLENGDSMLPQGDYELGHDGRRSATPYYVKGKASKEKASKGKTSSDGKRCQPAKRVLLSPGNGIDGGKMQSRILLGETLYLGFLVHSQEAYEQVTDRLRMQLGRQRMQLGTPRHIAVHIRQSEDYFEVA